MAKFCSECGSLLPEKGKFCPECGAAVGVVIDAPAGSTVTVTDTPPEAAVRQIPKPAAASQNAKKQPERAARKKTEKAAKGGRRGLSLFLVLVMLVELAVAGFKYPGFLRKKEDDAPQLSEESFVDSTPSGVSEIQLTKEDYSVEPERVTVSASDGCCQLESGVKVDFGSNTAICAGKELAVRIIGGRTDERYEAKIYDFSLTDTSTFSAPVKITLPYDKSWGNNVFVQYYNEDTGAWEVLWTETDGEGNAVFCTGHFSTFAVFRDMVTGKEPVTDDGPVIAFLKDPSRMEKDTLCYINYAALAYQVKNGGKMSLSELGNPSDTYWTERSMSILNNTGGAAGYVFDAASFAEGGSVVYKGASNALTRFGYVMTAAKIFTQYYRTGDMAGTLSTNKADLASAALTAASELTAGGVSTALGAAALALYVTSTAQSVMEDINLRGKEDMTEYAYRLFTGDNATVIMNSKNGLICSYKYAPTEYERLAYLTWNKNEVPLTDKMGLSAADWVAPLMFIAEHYSYENIPKAVDNLLTQYVNIFWNVERLDQQTFNSFLENTKAGVSGTKSLKSEYKTPSKAKRQEYTARYKAELYAWLKPYLNDIMEQAYFKMLNSVFDDAQALEKLLNTQLTFTLADEKCDTFADSVYAAYDCSLALSEDGEAIWRFSPDENWTLSCSRLMYLYAGCPVYVKVTNGTETVFTKKFALNGDAVTITLGESEETLLTEPEEDYWLEDNEGDAYWVLSKFVYVPYQSNKDVPFGDKNALYGIRTTDTRYANSRKIGGETEVYSFVDSNNLQLSEEISWSADLPGAILQDSSEFTYRIHQKDEAFRYGIYYPGAIQMPCSETDEADCWAFSGEGVIPASEEGGSREIMIVIHDIGLVYRECSFEEAVDTEPLTVEMDPIDYWKKK